MKKRKKVRRRPRRKVRRKLKKRQRRKLKKRQRKKLLVKVPQQRALITLRSQASLIPQNLI